MDSMLEAVLLMAFYGFLRCGEYTTRSLSFNPQHVLTLSDLNLQEHMYSFHSDCQILPRPSNYHCKNLNLLSLVFHDAIPVSVPLMNKLMVANLWWDPGSL